MKKRVLLCTAIALLLVSMAGCKSKKEEVKLKSEKEIVQYASKEYGKAKYISKESGSDLIKFTLQDNEYKFYYECTSSINQFCIDLSCAEAYFETTTCNFDGSYKNYIVDTLNLDNIYKNFHQNYPSNSGEKEFLVALNYENEEEARKNIGSIAKRITDIDTRKYLSNYYIALYDNNNMYFGVYNITTNKYINRYDAAVDSMTRAFASEVNKNSGNLDGIKYLYYKRIQYKDVEKLQMEWVYRKNVTAEDWTTAYYFEYYGKTYFMLDDKVFITDKNIFNRYIADKYYTSYWFIN